MKTKERLAQALETAGVPSGLVMKAREGWYDDYESHSATPKADLVRDLHRLGRPDLVARVRDGEFDNTKEEGDAWVASPEGQATQRLLNAGYFNRGA